MPENITQSVGSKFVAIAAPEFTRPANTTAYTAGDVVSNSASATTMLKFALCARSPGGSGAIVKARLTTDKKDETGVLRLLLFTRSELTTPAVSVAADNAAGTILYANRLYFVGQLDFPAASSGADTSGSTAAIALWTGGVGSSTVATGPLPFNCYLSALDNTLSDTALYGVLINTAGSTPASGQKFTVELTILQN